MPAQVKDILIEQGSTFRDSYIHLDDQDPPQPIDISLYSARGEIRSKATDAAALATFVCTIALGTDGKVDIELPAADSSAITLTGKNYLDLKTAYYDIELYDTATDTEVIRIRNGKASLSPEITKTAP